MSKLADAQKQFVDKLIQSLEKDIIPWRATWDKPLQKNYNAATNKVYQGTNELVLFVSSCIHNYDDPRWMTFKQANEKGYKIKRGSVGTQIYHYALKNYETGEILTRQQYEKLSEEEQKNIFPVSKTFTVFNAKQIDGIPELTNKKEIIFENDKAEDFANRLQKNMNVELKHEGYQAYYSQSKDMVVLPNKNTFMDEQAYYATRFHEFGHATMHPTRLNRECKGTFGSEQYAIEELRAELASVFLTLDVGFHLDTFHENNHQAYIKSWMNVLKTNPKILFDAIKDAQSIHEYILEKGEFEKIYQLDKQTEKTNLNKVNIENPKSKVMDAEYYLAEKQEIEEAKEEKVVTAEKEKRKTVVINLFAGPGAGKTTCAWEIASKLKKMYYSVEYVPEYAKELVWDENMEKLDGSIQNQQSIFDEQLKRINRLEGKVDFIVTDAPLLNNISYLKCDDLNVKEQYEQQVIDEFKNHKNINFFVNRGSYFEQEGRMQNLEESKKIDQSIQQMLQENHIEYDSFEYETIDKAIHKSVFLVNENLKNYEKTVDQRNTSNKKDFDLNVIKNSVSIVEYARDVLGFTSIKEGKGLVRFEQHDSCKVYPNNTFYRYSQNVGGSIIDFIKHFQLCDTKEAIERATNYYLDTTPDIRYNTNQKTQRKTFSMDLDGIEVPEKAETNKHVYAYLTKTRGIKSSIVNEYINRKILYEDTNRNCVFVGKINNTIYYANVRGTGSKAHKKDVLGSSKEVGIYIDNGSKTLVINEAPIDQMSYMSMVENPKAFNYLSVCGAGNTINALNFHMKKREEAKSIERIIIGLDNDEAGEENSLKAIEYLKENYPNIEVCVHIPEAKDFNEQLTNELKMYASIAPIPNEKLDMI